MKIVRLFLNSFFSAVFILLISIPVILLILSIEKQALVPEKATLNTEQISEIQQLLINNDPRLLFDADEKIIQLSEDELNSLLSYFVSNILQMNNTSLHVDIVDNRAIFELSVHIPELPFGNYINLSLGLNRQQEMLIVSELGLGGVNIPGYFFKPSLMLAHQYLKSDDNYQLLNSLLATIQGINLSENIVTVSLNMQDENILSLRNQVQQLFISDEEKNRLLAYHNKLVEISNSFPEFQRQVTLNDFLVPFFKTALQNSNNGADAVAENQAVFIIMTSYLTDLRLEHLIGADGQNLPEARNISVRVESRTDLPLHIISSAAIAASTNADVADILSIFKEVQDSRTRSGFSFSDITANQVGVALGTLASGNQEQALRLQRLMSESTNETEYMPLVGGMDGLSEQEFNRQYGSRDSALYRQRLQKIEAEVNSRPLFQAFNANIEFIIN